MSSINLPVLNFYLMYGKFNMLLLFMCLLLRRRIKITVCEWFINELILFSSTNALTINTKKLWQSYPFISFILVNFKYRYYNNYYLLKNKKQYIFSLFPILTTCNTHSFSLSLCSTLSCHVATCNLGVDSILSTSKLYMTHELNNRIPIQFFNYGLYA